MEFELKILISIVSIMGAYIALVIGMVKLIITKEITISDHRNKWSDNIVLNVSKAVYSSKQLNAYWGDFRFHLKGDEEQFDYEKVQQAMSPTYKEFEQSVSIIKSSLNREEGLHTELLVLLEKVETALDNHYKNALVKIDKTVRDKNFDNLNAICNQITVETKNITKDVWEKIKSGETRYQNAMNPFNKAYLIGGSGLIMVIMILFFIPK